MPIARIQLEDGRIGRFEVPEGTTPEQVQSYAEQQFSAKSEQPSMGSEAYGPSAPQKSSVGMDMLKSAAGGLERGAMAAPMILPNMLNQAAAGPQMLGKGMYDTFMGNPTDKNFQPWQPFYSSEDVLQGLPEPLRPHTPETAAGVGVDLLGQMAGGAAGTKAVKTAGNSRIVTDATSGRTTQPKAANADDLKALSNQTYAAAEAKGAPISQKHTDKFINDMNKSTPQTEAGKMLSGDSPVTKIVERINTLKGRALSFKEAQEIDEFLGDKIDEFTTLGVVNKQGKKLLDIQTSFRDMMDNVPDAGFAELKAARKLWSAQARLRDLEKIVRRAEMTENPATSMKNGFKNLYHNKSRMRGFDAQEKALIKRAAKSGVVGDLLGIAGSRLNPIIAMATGSGGVAGSMAAQAGSMAARGAKTQLQLSRAQKLTDTVANNATGNVPRKAVRQPWAPTPQEAAMLLYGLPMRQEDK